VPPLGQVAGRDRPATASVPGPRRACLSPGLHNGHEPGGRSRRRSPLGWPDAPAGPIRRNRGSVHHVVRGGRLSAAANALAGSCRPGRGRAATPSRADGALAAAVARFPRPPCAGRATREYLMAVRFQLVIDCRDPEPLAVSGPQPWDTSASRCRGRAPGRARSLVRSRAERRGARPLRNRHARSRGPRVRHQLRGVQV
jgi:hypothetical protein